MVNCSKSPVEKMTAFENIENCHIFWLNVLSQWEGSTNYSNQLPLPQRVAEHGAEHLTTSCVCSQFLCSFFIFSGLLK